jgi:hypothetical protein
MSRKAYSYLVSVGNRFLTGAPEKGFTWDATNADDAYPFRTISNALDALSIMDMSKVHGKASIIKVSVEEMRLGNVPEKKRRPPLEFAREFDGTTALWMADVMNKAGTVPRIMIVADQMIMRYTGHFGRLFIPVTDRIRTVKSVEVMWVKNDGEKNKFKVPADADSVAGVIKGFMEH